MRSKENQADYRFIPDPDLPTIKITQKRISEIKKNLPESPQEKLEKIIKKHKIDEVNANILTQHLEIAELYEKVIEKINAKFALPWITVELFGALNHHKKTMNEVNIQPEHIIELLQLLEKEKLTPLKTKEILRKFVPESFSPKKLAADSEKINNKDELTTIIKEILVKNKKSIEDYKAGEEKSFNFLMGQIMQATNRRADFQIARGILEKELK